MNFSKGRGVGRVHPAASPRPLGSAAPLEISVSLAPPLIEATAASSGRDAAPPRDRWREPQGAGSQELTRPRERERRDKAASAAADRRSALMAEDADTALMRRARTTDEIEGKAVAGAAERRRPEVRLPWRSRGRISARPMASAAPCARRRRNPPDVRTQVWPARLGSARLGSARLGSARLGSARLGSARLGSARLGSARLGSANYSVRPLIHPVSQASASPRVGAIQRS